MSDLGFYLGIRPLAAEAIVVATGLLYLVFALLLSRFGQRLFASPSGLELAVVSVLGAIVGRSILGQGPTLAGGLIALATLFALETVWGRLRRSSRVLARRRHRAVALMVAGQIDYDELRRHHLDEVALWGVLRSAGVRAPDEVALVVLEKSGRFSVIRAGAPIHSAALTGVRGAAEILARVG